MDLTNEQLEKANAAKSVDELLALAKAEGIELTESDAQTFFLKHIAEEAELSDEELDSVAGGGDCGGGNSSNIAYCQWCERAVDASNINCPYCNHPLQ